MASDERVMMVHPPDRDSNLLFVDWAAYALDRRKGIKLDLKNPDVIALCFDYLASRSLPAPVVINADVFQGPGGSEPIIDPGELISACSKLPFIPLLSLGWTSTVKSGLRYTTPSIELARELGRSYDGPVTFAIRTCYLKESWDDICRLTEDEGSTLTLWNGSEDPLTKGQSEWIERTLDPAFYFCDLVSTSWNPIRLTV